MSDTVLTALIVSIAPTIAALAAWRNSRHVSGKMDQLEENTNHKMDQLLEVTATSQHAAGKEEERIEEQGRQQVMRDA